MMLAGDAADLVRRVDACIEAGRGAGTLVGIRTGEVVVVDDDGSGMRFQVRIAQNLVAKEASDARQRVAPRFPFLPPFETGLFVGDLDDQHRLLLNKFCISARHVLVVTTEFEPQNRNLTAGALRCIIPCMDALHGLAFFNHGPDSGGTQPHFHVQIIPRRQTDQLDDVPLADVIARHDHVPPLQTFTIDVWRFRHRAVRFSEQAPATPDAVEQLYLSMLGALALDSATSYSWLLCSDFMVVVPRSSSHCMGIGVNSLAFAGCIFLKDESQMTTLQQDVGGPMRLLERIATQA
ncbi:hypothetical protein PBRA_008563 [Plasmodiophora brassicae]|uniref:Uncharacterized protein n=1 Tax=Plasmodiophora brassicae TaxID=37360 RepID=A0A0G4J316_PLABS|nr:hypothetical protein PBRA_008563 [Plasmodiophora brassicae]